MYIGENHTTDSNTKFSQHIHVNIVENASLELDQV